MNDSIKKALETWHGGDGLDGRVNMALSLIGEVGEVTNLYRKMFFKPGYVLEKDKALDELGDVWYYIRIFAYLDHQHELDVIISNLSSYNSTVLHKDAIINVLTNLHHLGLKVEDWALQRHYFSTKEVLGDLILQLSFLLRQWECSLDELTELNHKKLTKDADHHGWKASEDLQKMSQEEYRRLSEGNWTEYDEGLEKEVEAAAEMYKKSLENMKKEPPYVMFPQQEEDNELYEDLGDEKEPPLVQVEEDWREAMQKRIVEREKLSRELRGRWY